MGREEQEWIRERKRGGKAVRAPLQMLSEDAVLTPTPSGRLAAGSLGQG